MKNLILVCSILLSVMSVTPAFAAIGCLPGQCGPGGTPNPDDGLTPPHVPSKPIHTDADGYFEVASPNCTDEDLAAAQQGALEKALVDAQRTLRTEDVVQTSAPKFLIQRCEQSIYAGSFKGNSWIIYVVVGYSIQD